MTPPGRGTFLAGAHVCALVAHLALGLSASLGGALALLDRMLIFVTLLCAGGLLTLRWAARDADKTSALALDLLAIVSALARLAALPLIAHVLISAIYVRVLAAGVPTLRLIAEAAILWPILVVSNLFGGFVDDQSEHLLSGAFATFLAVIIVYSSAQNVTAAALAAAVGAAALAPVAAAAAPLVDIIIRHVLLYIVVARLRSAAVDSPSTLLPAAVQPLQPKNASADEAASVPVSPRIPLLSSADSHGLNGKNVAARHLSSSTSGANRRHSDLPGPVGVPLPTAEDTHGEVGRLALEVAKKDALLERLALEMRTLASAALGMVELLQDSYAQQGAHEIEKDFVRSIGTSLETLNAMVVNAVDLVRAESGRITLDDRVPLRLENVLDELIASAPSTTSAVDVSYEIADDVPGVLVGDGGILTRILSHLVANAVTFTQRGSVHISASVSKTLPAENAVVLRIRVADTGRGIASSHLKHIFAPFFSLRQTGSGTGLGLAVCNRLTALFPYGKISVASEAERGTVVTFRGQFGIVRTSSERDLALSSSLEEIHAQILLVGDPRKPLMRSVECMLRRHDQTVAAVLGSSETLKSFVGQGGPDAEPFVALIDYAIPATEEEGAEPISALEIARELALFAPHVRVVVMGHPAQRETFLRDPNQSSLVFLSKPVRYDAMRNCIAKAVRSGPWSPSSTRSSSTSSEGVFGVLNESTSGNSGQSTSPVRHGSGSSGPLRVLVAEDNPLMRHTLVRMIEGFGSLVLAAENGQVCANLFTDDPNTFDIVLMDLQMPVMDGFESARTIRAFDREHGRPRSFIVALTATEAREVTPHNLLQEGAKEEGPLFDEVITKPLTRKMLLTLLARIAKKNTSLNTTGRVVANASDFEAVREDEERGPVRVLVVEDNDMIAKITAKVLRQGGCDVTLARHGAEALALLTEQYAAIDLVLMDVLMPVMDGWTCTRLLRQFENERHLQPKPVVALSTNVQPSHRTACLEAGCTDFAAKPIDYPTLQGLVRKHVAGVTQMTSFPSGHLPS